MENTLEFRNACYYKCYETIFFTVNWNCFLLVCLLAYVSKNFKKIEQKLNAEDLNK